MSNALREQGAHLVKLSTWFLFHSESGTLGYCDPDLERPTRGDQPVDESMFGYGFSFMYRRDIALRYPFPSQTMGEDYVFLQRLQILGFSICCWPDIKGVCLRIQHGSNTSNAFACDGISRETLKASCLAAGKIFTEILTKHPGKASSSHLVPKPALHRHSVFLELALDILQPMETHTEFHLQTGVDLKDWHKQSFLRFLLHGECLEPRRASFWQQRFDQRLALILIAPASTHNEDVTGPYEEIRAPFGSTVKDLQVRLAERQQIPNSNWIKVFDRELELSPDHLVLGRRRLRYATCMQQEGRASPLSSSSQSFQQWSSQQCRSSNGWNNALVLNAAVENDSNHQLQWPSLAEVLQYARPDWSVEDHTKVLKKLEKISVVDFLSLQSILESQTLNEQLDGAGQKRILPNTIKLLQQTVHRIEKGQSLKDLEASDIETLQEKVEPRCVATEPFEGKEKELLDSQGVSTEVQERKSTQTSEVDMVVDSVNDVVKTWPPWWQLPNEGTMKDLLKELEPGPTEDAMKELEPSPSEDAMKELLKEPEPERTGTPSPSQSEDGRSVPTADAGEQDITREPDPEYHTPTRVKEGPEKDTGCWLSAMVQAAEHAETCEKEDPQNTTSTETSKVDEISDEKDIQSAITKEAAIQSTGSRYHPLQRKLTSKLQEAEISDEEDTQSTVAEEPAEHNLLSQEEEHSTIPKAPELGVLPKQRHRMWAFLGLVGALLASSYWSKCVDYSSA